MANKKFAFMAGAAIGAAITAYFTTEKGKEVKDTLKQAALLGISAIEDAFRDKEAEEDIEEEAEDKDEQGESADA